MEIRNFVVMYWLIIQHYDPEVKTALTSNFKEVIIGTDTVCVLNFLISHPFLLIFLFCSNFGTVIIL